MHLQGMATFIYPGLIAQLIWMLFGSPPMPQQNLTTLTDDLSTHNQSALWHCHGIQVSSHRDQRPLIYQTVIQIYTLRLGINCVN